MAGKLQKLLRSLSASLFVDDGTEEAATNTQGSPQPPGQPEANMDSPITQDTTVQPLKIETDHNLKPKQDVPKINSPKTQNTKVQTLKSDHEDNQNPEKDVPRNNSPETQEATQTFTVKEQRKRSSECALGPIERDFAKLNISDQHDDESPSTAKTPDSHREETSLSEDQNDFANQGLPQRTPVYPPHMHGYAGCYYHSQQEGYYLYTPQPSPGAGMSGMTYDSASGPSAIPFQPNAQASIDAHQFNKFQQGIHPFPANTGPYGANPLSSSSSQMWMGGNANPHFQREEMSMDLRSSSVPSQQQAVENGETVKVVIIHREGKEQEAEDFKMQVLPFLGDLGFDVEVEILEHIGEAGMTKVRALDCALEESDGIMALYFDNEDLKSVLHEIAQFTGIDCRDKKTFVPVIKKREDKTKFPASLRSLKPLHTECDYPDLKKQVVKFIKSLHNRKCINK